MPHVDRSAVIRALEKVAESHRRIHSHAEELAVEHTAARQQQQAAQQPPEPPKGA